MDPVAIQKALATHPVLAAKYAGPARLENARQGARQELVHGRQGAALGAALESPRRGDGSAGRTRRSTVSSSSARRCRSTGRRSASCTASTPASTSAGTPAVGVETRARRSSAMPFFRQLGLSTVDDVRRRSAGSRCRLARGRGARPLRARGRAAPPPVVPAAARRWLSRSRSSSPRATRRSGSGRRSRRCGEAFPDAEVIVADDGSRDGTAAGRRRRPARPSSRLPARGKGQALSAAERAAPPGRAAARRRRSPRRPHAAAARVTPISAIAAFAQRRAAASGSRSGSAGALIRLVAASSRASRSPASARSRRRRVRRASRSRRASAARCG